MLSKMFSWLAGQKSPAKPWHLQTLNWQVKEYQLDWELAESAINWLSVRDTANLLDQIVQDQHLIVFGFDGQQFSQSDYISFELLVECRLVFILANDAQTMFAPLAQQYRKLGTGIIRDNRANDLLGTHDLLVPEALIQHKGELVIVSHDADSIF